MMRLLLAPVLFWQRHRWMLSVGLLVLAGCLLLQMNAGNNSRFNQGLGRIDAMLYDWRFKLLPPKREALPNIVIVDLDEFTLQREGRWPWDRARVAELIDALREQGAAIIGFDVVFSEAGINPVQQLLDSAQLSGHVRTALSAQATQFDGDAILAASLDPFVVLGYFLHADGGKTGVLPAPLLVMSPASMQISMLQSLPDYTGSLPVLMDAGASGGFVVAIPDGDGIVRRVPLVLRHEDGVYSALSLEMARLAINAPWIRVGTDLRFGREVTTHVQIGRTLQIPVDEAGNMLVPYRGKGGSYTTISATKIIRQDTAEHERAALRDALVLVGTSALGLSDLRTIPLQTAFPGVEVHANTLDTILQAAMGENTLYHQPDWAPGATIVLLVVVGLLLTLVLPGRSPWAMLAVVSATFCVVVLMNAAVWHYGHIALPLASLLLLLLLLSVLNIANGYLVSNRQRQSIQRLFGEYVPPGYVDQMLRQPHTINLAGEQRDMTVLFADVRQFTSISEHLSANALKTLLNRYLSCVTEVIFAHGGTIDKYVGDLVMAFWNAPLDDRQHAQHAVAAALAMQRRMQDLRHTFAQEGLPEMVIGIGINTGSMNVGDMGSSYRRAYTVLGDAVNLGSRLESLTAFYQIPIMVSGHTRDLAPDFLYRTIDLIRVKGKREAVEVCEPLCTLKEASSALISRVQRHEKAIEMYCKRDWVSARDMFNQLLLEDTESGHLYTLYLMRMHEAQAMQQEWDPVYNHLGK